MSEPRRKTDLKFSEAVILAKENYLELTQATPEQYRIEAKDQSWYKELFPKQQRIFCPDKVKQGPFISMRIGQKWDLVDIVKACLKAMAKEQANPKTPVVDNKNLFSGTAEDTQEVLIKLIKAVTDFEAADKQGALRDLMTDLRHVADRLKLCYHEAEKGSYEVYLEEKKEP